MEINSTFYLLLQAAGCGNLRALIGAGVLRGVREKRSFAAINPHILFMSTTAISPEYIYIWQIPKINNGTGCLENVARFPKLKKAYNFP